MSVTGSGWIFAGQRAVILLPLMLIGIGVSLAVAIVRDRALRRSPQAEKDAPVGEEPERVVGETTKHRRKSRHKR